MGVFIPPDFTNFWKQAIQQGWKPKLATYAKALLFPQSVEALGSIANGLTTEVWWTPNHPFTSSFLGETCKQFADKFTAANNNAQWTQPLLHFIVFEMAVDVLKRTTSVDDKEAIITAVKTTKLDTIGGPIDFTAPVVGATPPFKVGPVPHRRERLQDPAGRRSVAHRDDLSVRADRRQRRSRQGLGIPVQDKVQAYV